MRLSHAGYVTATLMLLAAVGCASRDQPAASPAPRWTNTVWRVVGPAGRAPGSFYVFLDDGTLVMTSCVETYRLARWEAIPGGRIAITEDIATSYQAEIAEHTDGNLRLQLILKTETVALTLAKAEAPFVCPDLPR